MPFLSAALQRLKPSASLQISTTARDMRARGLDVISLAAGQPDYDTPVFIKEAAKAALDAGETGYTRVDGSRALKQAIIQKLMRDNGLTYGEEEITVNAGGKQTIFNALLATINPGDEVIIPAPYWVSYPDIVRFAGGTPVLVAADGAQDFKITPDQLAAAITRKTKWVILNNPNNPSGAVYSAAEQQALGTVLADHPQIWVLSDEIYEHLIYNDQPFTSFAAACPTLKDRTLTVNGMSKSYAMTGWRLGFGAAPAPLIDAIRTLQGQSTSCPCSITQAASIAALNGDQRFLDDWRRSFNERRQYLVSQLNALPGMQCPMPQGAFYAFADISALLGLRTANGQQITTDEEFCAYLLDQHLVAAIAGSAYGMPGHIRVSYATSMDQLVTACERLSQAVNALH